MRHSLLKVVALTQLHRLGAGAVLAGRESGDALPRLVDVGVALVAAAAEAAQGHLFVALLADLRSLVADRLAAPISCADVELLFSGQLLISSAQLKTVTVRL